MADKKFMTDEDIIDEYGVTKNFIDRHASQMKPYTMPRKFLRSNMEAFFIRHSERDLEKKSIVDELLNDVFKKVSHER